MLVYTFGFLLILVALWILAIATGWGLPYFLIADGLNWLRVNPWESIVVAGVLLLLGLLLFLRPRASTDHSFRTSSKNGDVRISQDALQEIIARSAKSLQGVVQVKSSLRQREAGLEIIVMCQFEQGVLIPQVSGEILTKVKEDVELYTGIIVAEVKVLVRNLEKVRSVRVR
ncbi:alkaline shock response membrane anchor protein AmaP [Desulfosporosinus sp.]|uniref:alkaline shock response membrane anchor protein AmaP n=1 Tax=Desulfosporosinus sp. TaxID=157907 RepID=UPI000E8353A2|nr:alkaline shock response membrane anchor protein AmaP [Desulfosporosinus sp.]MBC2722364.1 alkaline shock response membrane anchor protein AmaP [Desulfosporosinus sp.]MBC2726862.1 alkaline shock response membrane anchor protein AmaP [Desulfosporosinus sp.]HBV89062.1 alkaline shock response membrane anchor protein AmaP [Desulfosporosinus sp.]